MIEIADLSPTEAVFTHFDDVTHERRIFATDRLRTAVLAARLPVTLTAVDPHYAQWMISARGMEVHRLRPHLGVCSLDPILYCALEDAEHLCILVDGTHRYIAAAINDSLAIPAYLVPRALWEPFLVTGVPYVDEDTAVRSYSGM